MVPSPVPHPRPVGDVRRATAGGVVIDPLGFADLPQVLAIERRSYPAPWSLAMFVLEVAKPGGLCVLARAAPGDGTGASGGPRPARDRQGPITGYALVSRFDDAFHVMNVCTDPDRRREGIARALLDHVIERAGGTEARLTLEVRPSNEGARKLYDDLGFVAVGRRKRYYRDDGEDAFIMWRTPATLQGTTDDVPGAEHEKPGAKGPVPPDAALTTPPADEGGGGKFRRGR